MFWSEDFKEWRTSHQATSVKIKLFKNTGFMGVWDHFKFQLQMKEINLDRIKSMIGQDF